MEILETKRGKSGVQSIVVRCGEYTAELTFCENCETDVMIPIKALIMSAYDLRKQREEQGNRKKCGRVWRRFFSVLVNSFPYYNRVLFVLRKCTNHFRNMNSEVKLMICINLSFAFYFFAFLLIIQTLESPPTMNSGNRAQSPV